MISDIQFITGASLSTTITSKLHVLVLPAASVTLKGIWSLFLLGMPIPDASPAICTVVAIPQLSVPTGATYVTTAVAKPESTFWVISDGHTIVGSIVSFTVMRLGNSYAITCCIGYTISSGDYSWVCSYQGTIAYKSNCWCCCTIVCLICYY